MHPLSIIEKIERSGGKLIVEGGRLRAGIPRTREASQLRDLIAGHRDELIRWLEHGEEPELQTRNRALVRFTLKNGRGGQVIAPDGLPPAVSDLVQRFGDELSGIENLEWIVDYIKHDPDATKAELDAAVHAMEIIKRAQRLTA